MINIESLKKTDRRTDRQSVYIGLKYCNGRTSEKVYKESKNLLKVLLLGLSVAKGRPAARIAINACFCFRNDLQVQHRQIFRENALLKTTRLASVLVERTNRVLKSRNV
jgi:hypothetical protein